ncbi:MAG: hypothetical protein V9G12_06005 [Microthrixaceae bacterium]
MLVAIKSFFIFYFPGLRTSVRICFGMGRTEVRVPFCKRPLCMFANHGFFVLHGLFKDGDIFFTASVANSHSKVAQISAPFGTLDGTALEALIKLNGCQSQV